MKTLPQIAEETYAWRDKNFPPNTTPYYDSHEQLLGVIEEVGELHTANDLEVEVDAVGDITVFAMGYCQRRGWSFEEIYNEARGHIHTKNWWASVGALAHAEIKAAQGIRGSAEELDTAGRTALAELLGAVLAHCEVNGINYEVAVNNTWDHVSQRDWNANKVDGTVDA